MSKGIEEAIKDSTIGDVLRNAPFPAFAMPGLPAEYSNWADEQRSWREAVCLYDQSHHMTDVTLKGPGVIPLLSSIAVNDFSTFPVDTAKQLVAVNGDGYVIGDSIVFRLGEDEYRIVGGPPAPNWVHFHAETRDQGIEIGRDDNSYVRRGDPELYRYQIQGPKALDVMREVLGAEPPKLKFFAMGHVTIAGRHVRALRHGMAGQAGYELFGPWADGDAVKSALLEAGAEFGIRLVGGLAYITNALESGWIPRPLPAIYSDDPLLAEYRKWLAATGDPVIATVGGSLAPADVTGYYFTPFELGYGKVVKFNHDFIGREALERAAAEGRDTARSKVTLVWNADDAAGLAGSVFQPGPGAKILNLPMPLYATFQFDRVLAGGKDIGRTAFTGYSANERAVLALATVDSAYAEPGTEVTVLWGESPNTAKPTAEPHVQVALRAIVQSAPITQYARTAYRAASA